MNSMYLSSCFNNQSKSYFINNPTIKGSALQFQNGGWGSHTSKQFLDTSRVFYFLIQVWHYLPREGIRFHGLKVQSTRLTALHPRHTHSLSLQMSVTSPDYHHLCFWLTSYRVEVPITLYLGSINSLQRLTKFTRFIIKGYNLGKANERNAQGKDMWEGRGASMPSPGSPFCPNLHMFTYPEALRTLSFAGFEEDSLQRHAWWNHWSLVPELSL